MPKPALLANSSKLRKNPKSLTRWLKIGVIVVVIFLAGFMTNAAIFRLDYNKTIGFSNRANRPSLGQFWNVYDILGKKYDGSINSSDFINGAIRGSVASLNDPYTVFLSAKEAQDLRDQLSGNLNGIGVEIGIKNNKLTVIAPIDDTPAAAAGIRSGDIISAIDGKDATSYTLDEAVSKIRGPKDTKVKLIITRGTNSHEVEITRAQITVDSVTSSIRPDGIGVIRIRDFGDTTSQRVAQVASQFKNAHVKGIVLDLRDNPGGYLQSAVDVVSNFQKDGLVVVEKGKDKSADKSYYATGDGQLIDTPIVVLVNGGTASAAEITAGALQDKRAATLIGQTTFGKGVVQEILDLAGGNQLKVTVAKWYTPNGTNISKSGIKPTIEIANSEADFNAGTDPQFDKALSILTSKIP